MENLGKKIKIKHLGKHIQNFIVAGEKVQIGLKYGYFGDILYYQFTAVDMASQVVYARLYEKKTPENVADFVRKLIKIFPFKIQTIQTDHDTEFTYSVKSMLLTDGIARPWYNGAVERVHKTYKDLFHKLSK